MIEIENIKKSFGDKTVLKGISGQFKDGINNLIIGSSGTGKSVLLKCIVGLMRPEEGQVRYDGVDFYACDGDTRKEIRQQIGMLFQGSALFDSKTVEENVRFPLDMRSRMRTDEKNKRVAEVLEQVGLGHAADRMPSEISGGMMKRVGIARAIVMKPKYLFCDEPNSGLDPQTSITIDELIGQVTSENQMTSIVVTHDMNSVVNIGDHIMFLAQGHKLWEGNNREILFAENEELQNFVFASKIMRSVRDVRNAEANQ